MIAKRIIFAAATGAVLGAAAACGSTTTGPSAIDEPFDNPPVAPTDTSGMAPAPHPVIPG